MKTTTFSPIRLLLSISLLFLFCGIHVSAETCIKGRILDNTNQPVTNATALLYSIDDSALLQGDMCDERGVFNLTNVKPGVYMLTLRCVGYGTDNSRIIIVEDNTAFVDVRTIRLSEAVFMLAEVEVVAERCQKPEPSNS
jgi:hypothetical protein